MKNTYISFIILLTITGSLFATDWENPNGRPWLLSLKLGNTGYGLTLPVTNWMTVKISYNESSYKDRHMGLNSNQIGHFYIPENMTYDSAAGGYYYMETNTYLSNNFNTDGYDLYTYSPIYYEESKKIILENIQLEFHIPLNKLWEK